MPAYRSIRDRMLCECDVDGFRAATPEFAAYCPVERRKVLAADHAGCGNFGGYLYAETGEAAGVRCLHPLHRS